MRFPRRNPIILIIISCTLVITGCSIFPLPSAPDPDDISPPEEVFEIPQVEVEVDMPVNIEDVDFILGLSIVRTVHIEGPEFDFFKEDVSEVAVWGEDNMLYGLDEDGEHTFVITSGVCTVECPGKIGYLVKGFVRPDCMLEMWITQIPEPVVCTGSCPGGPDVPTMATTGLAEHVLDPLEADFVQLKDGVTRDEFIGNADWVANYKMTSFEGKVNIPGCKYDLEIP